MPKTAIAVILAGVRSRCGSFHKRNSDAGCSTLERRAQQSQWRRFRRRMAAVLARPLGAVALHLVLA
jgi:hypothetical protein